MKRCITCLNTETRPRVEFNKAGVCNGCQHTEKKAKIDWEKRWQDLEKLCDKFRNKNRWDVIVPVSGGKDSSFVAWKLKYDLGMNPLCVTFSPPMQTEIGRINLENFRNSGFDLIEIRPNPEVYRRLCKKMFIEQARSKFPFVIGIGTSVSRVALNFGIPFIMWGENGEEEYGGKTTSQDFMTYEFMTKFYHEGNDLSKWTDEFTEAELQWWMLPPKKDIEALSVTWYSKWAPWDDQLHRDVAIEKCGLKGTASQTGTFTTHSQIDDMMQDLLMYECFVKFGFGRATADCNLAIKAGRMTRDTGIEIVKEQDGEFPLQYLYEYLEYFQMEEWEFWEVLHSHANLDILQQVDDPARPYILRDPVI